MRAEELALALILAIAGPLSAAQPSPHAAKERARALLHDSDIEAWGKAQQRLEQKGESYDIQRVEITGMMSDDDTERSYPGLFSPGAQVKPSYKTVFPEVNKKPNIPRSMDSIVKWWFDSVTMPGAIVSYASGQTMVFSMDGMGAGYATMRGRLSEREQEVLQPLKGKEIGEIVAHSWGTELLYNAILEGAIRPPKSIIIIGSPDRNIEKWNVLADRTGTNVKLFGGKKDAVNSVIQLAPRALPLFVPKDRERLLALWNARCTNRALEPCNQYHREGSVVADFNLAVDGHDRFGYYDLLRQRGYLRDSATDLEAIQQGRLENELDVLAEPYLAKAYKSLREEAAAFRKNREASQPVAIDANAPPVAFAEPPTPGAHAPPVIAPPEAYAPPLSHPPEAEDELMEVARKVCGNPAVERRELPPLAWFPAPTLRPVSIEGWKARMSGCELLVIESLLATNALGKPYDLDQIKRLATPPPAVIDAPQKKDRPCTPRGIWSKECY